MHYTPRLSKIPMTIRRFLDGHPLGRGGYLLLSVWLLFLIGGFSLARSLQPHPRGYGTHQQLGLPPCSFRMLAGIPCPSCGMTTSFAYFTRGNLVKSFQSNPAGLVLATLCAILLPWGVASLWTRRTVGIDHPAEAFVAVGISLMTVCLLNWCVMIVNGW